KDVSLGLQSPAKVHGTDIQASCHDDRIDGRVGQDLLYVADRSRRKMSLTEGFRPRARTGVDRNFVPAGRRQGLRYVEAIGMISQKCKSHRRPSQNRCWSRIMSTVAKLPCWATLTTLLREVRPTRPISLAVTTKPQVRK